IETIRVEPQRLDALLTLAGDLNVTTARVLQGLSRLRDLSAVWEEWSKDSAGLRPLFDNAGAAGESSARRLSAYYEREQLRLTWLGELLDRLKQTTFQDATRLDFVADEVGDAVRNMRLLPLSTIFNLFPRQVRDLARAQGKDVSLVIEGAETTADKRILEEIKDPLMHVVRNAVDHGIETPEERARLGKP